MEYWGVLLAQSLKRYANNWVMYAWMLTCVLLRFYFCNEILSYLASFDYEKMQCLEDLNAVKWSGLQVYVVADSYADSDIVNEV